MGFVDDPSVQYLDISARVHNALFVDVVLLYVVVLHKQKPIDAGHEDL